MKRKHRTPVFIICTILALGAGFYLGKSGNSQPATEEEQTEAKPSGETPATPSKPVVNSEDLAKEKNVPAVIKNVRGDYTLVAVIEGTDANHKLSESLKVVNAQRQRLTMLMRQFDQSPANAAQQRELLAQQINEIRNTLGHNLRFLAQKFAYSLNYNYVLIPHIANLNAVSEVDGKAKFTEVHKFTDALAYEKFQKQRAPYLTLKQQQIKQAQADAKKTPAADITETPGTDNAAAPDSPSTPPVATTPATAPKLKPTPEMEVIRQELIRLYKYDPEGNFIINFEKSALYARRAR